MIAIKGIIDKVATRKLVVTAVARAAAATGTMEVTWPIATIRWRMSQGRRWWRRQVRRARG